jgi:hypothetical protein
MLADAWKQNALLSEQLLGTRNDLDGARAQIECLTRDLEIERASRANADDMCRDLQERIADVTAERDEFTYQQEALIAARAVLANDLQAIDSVGEEQPEECADSESVESSVIAELLLARAMLANELDTIDADSESSVIEEPEYSLMDFLPLVSMESECAAGASKAEKRTSELILLIAVVDANPLPIQDSLISLTF